MTEGQRLAVSQLKAIEASSGGLFELLSVEGPSEDRPSVLAQVTVHCRHMPKTEDGLPLRDRERLKLWIPSDFPFEVPSLWVYHTRFAGFPHVQWGRHLCLYVAPSTEWNPSDGMFGFVTRLNEWLRQGAIGELDPVGAPLHPPVAYPTSGMMVVPRVDTPPVRQEPWLGTAHLKPVSEHRVDIIGWSELLAEGTPPPVAAAILLPRPFSFFEFPTKVAGLLEELERQELPRDRLLLTLQAAVLSNDKESPLYVVIGSPMRGIRGSDQLRQHLTVWYIEPTIAKALRISVEKYAERARLREIGSEVEDIIWEWAASATASWCNVREDRPEVTQRRDYAAPISWFHDKTVVIWGCGALGGHIGEFLARAGARKLILHDNGDVAPGILARQPYDDADIGESKVRALGTRLRRVRPELQVDEHAGNVLAGPLSGETWSENADCVIDATASPVVAKKLERQWGRAESSRVPVASMIIGHQADAGCVVTAFPEHSGGPADVFRRAKLEACERSELGDFQREFWPDQNRERRVVFQPEPGCSDSTFVGSGADVAALAALMLNHVARDLQQQARVSATAHFLSTTAPRAHVELGWEADLVVIDECEHYSVRISPTAWRQLRRWIKRSRYFQGRRVETGGVLFGERDDASRVVWVSQVSGPPPDSHASSTGFICGVTGTTVLNEEKRERTRGAVQFVGMWHTHPDSLPTPSFVDHGGMERILARDGHSTAKPLLLILGGDMSDPSPGAFLYSRQDRKTSLSELPSGSLAWLPTLQGSAYSLASWTHWGFTGASRRTKRVWSRFTTWATARWGRGPHTRQ